MPALAATVSEPAPPADSAFDRDAHIERVRDHIALIAVRSGSTSREVLREIAALYRMELNER